jgi:hypothetical protein
VRSHANKLQLQVNFLLPYVQPDDGYLLELKNAAVFKLIKNI